MRFMVIVKATKDTEAGVMPSMDALKAMGAFNEEMVKAGVMQAGEGVHPTSKGARIRFGNGAPAVSHGPFPFSGDLLAGFWLIETATRDDAIAWMKRAPFEGDVEIEIRQLFAPEGFGDSCTPELREREALMREQLEK